MESLWQYRKDSMIKVLIIYYNALPHLYELEESEDGLSVISLDPTNRFMSMLLDLLSSSVEVRINTIQELLDYLFDIGLKVSLL